MNQASTARALVPLMTLTETALNLFAAVLPAWLVLYAGNDLFLLALALIGALYLYSINFLILSALLMRFVPKPRLGRLTASSDCLRYGVLIALSNMLQRHPLAGLLLKTTPMPGNLFYFLAGANIHPTCLIAENAIICDPFLTEVAAGTVIGQQVVITGHLIPEPNVTQLGTVKIGRNVLIGINCVIYPSVEIGDNAQIQACSRVDPKTKIPAGEVWGGIPAVRIKDVQPKIIDT